MWRKPDQAVWWPAEATDKSSLPQVNNNEGLSPLPRTKKAWVSLAVLDADQPINPVDQATNRQRLLHVGEHT
jgi:hypothetical protein